MTSSSLLFQNQSIRVTPGIDVIGITFNHFNKDRYYALKTFLDWNSTDFTEHRTKKEWHQVRYNAVIQNRVYRITLIDSRYRELYLVRLYRPTIAVAKEVEKLLPEGTYTVSLIEHDFHFICPDESCASDLQRFLKESHHLSYLKKPSVVLKEHPGISYRSNPRLTKSMGVRIYINRWNPKAPKIEYVAKRKWIRKNGIESLLDCFLVSPQAVIKNSSFRQFNVAEIEKGLKRGGMRSNIASRYINRGMDILSAEGFHSAYRYFARRIPALYKPVLTPFHAFDGRFRSALEKLTFVK